MQPLSHKAVYRSITLGLIFAGLFCFGIYAFATPPGSAYNPGETLDPSCAPGDTNCTVIAQVPYTGATATLNLGSQNFNTTGTGTFGTLTDGTASLAGGSLTGVRLGSLTGNGFIKTSGGNGALSIDTTTYASASNNLGFFASTTSSQLAGIISDETGSGALVFGTSPSFTTPTLGAALATSINGLTITSSTGTLTLANGKTLTASNTLTFTGTDSSSVAFGGGGTVAYIGNKLSVFAATTSAELAGVISDETGSGSLVFANSPVLTTPDLGIPSAITLTNATGLPVSTGISGLGTGVETFLATPSSANLALAVTGETGSGALVFASSPTLVTPTLGAALATSINGLTISTSTGTLTVADGKTLTASNTLTFTGTDSSSVAFGGGGTVAYIGNKLSVFAATTSAELAGVISDETGSGSLVFADSPTFTTPTLGAATATSINGLTITSSTGTLTITNGKTFTTSSTLTLAGTDGSTLNIGSGGTLGTAAYTSASTYATTALDNLASVAINTSLIPGTSDGAALGSTAKMWSDLFLASGAVINFNNGDVTLTHSAGTLTLAGGTLVLPNSGLQIGSSNPFSDASGTLTLQNVDVLDGTSESTIEAAIDTLANLTSIQGQTLTLAGALITSGANSLTLTTIGTTNVTLPTSGTLATLAGSETLSSKTLTAPKFVDGGFLADANGNELIIFTTTSSAVNEITLANGATGVGPTFTASGETNVDINFKAKGSGVFNFKATASGPSDLRLFEDSDNGSNYISFIAPASLSGNIVLTGGTTSGTLAVLANKLSAFASTTSSELAGVISDETGSGLLVFGTAPTLASTVTIGTAGGTTGAINLKGTTSGTVTVTTAAAAGTWTLTLPDSAGTDGYVLKTNGSGVTSWVAQSGGSGITAPGTTTDNAIVRWDGIDGSAVQNSAITIDDSGNITGVGAITAGTVALGGISAQAYNAFSTSAGAGHAAIDAGNDLFLEGSLEVDAAAYFDGDVVIGGSLSGVNSITLNAIAVGDTALTIDKQIAVGGISDQAYNVFSTGGGPSLASVDGINDLFVEGSFEAGGASQFDGAITLAGTINLNGTLATSASGYVFDKPLAIGGISAQAYNVFSTGGGPGHAAIGAIGDVFIEGDLETDGEVYFDGVVTLGSTINKLTITAPATAATLTIADNKTFTVNNTLTLQGTDSSTIDFGTGGLVAYDNGVIWNLQTAAANNQWNSITYGNGLFVAVALTGTDDRIMTSPDGINWTSRTNPSNLQWTSVTYGNGIFVAVANDGSGNGL